jgi:uncharacterized protein
MDPKIARFLRSHHVLTLSTCSDEGSWTAHCFYAWMPDHQAVVFTSDPDTRHGQNMLKNPSVSGGICLETKVIGMIRGVQLTGRSYSCDGSNLPVAAAACRNAYLLKFPFALAAKLDLWVLSIDYIKMTDNRLGFGKKLIWQRENQ